MENQSGFSYNISNAEPILYNQSDNATELPLSEQDDPGCILYEFIVYTVLVGLLCILGVIGNLLAFTVYQKDILKTSTTFLFQGLSITDSILLVTAFPVYCLLPLARYYDASYYLHVVHPYILVYVLPWAQIAQTAAIWVTVLVGVNRYIAVCLPYQASRLCSVAKARQYLAFVLLFSFVYNIPRFAVTEIGCHEMKNNQTLCVPDYTKLGNNKLFQIIYYNICYTLFMLAIPLLILIVLNFRLIKTLKELKRRRAEMQTRQQQQDNNVTFVLIIVILVFVICQVPALATQIFWTVLPESARNCGGFQFFWSRISNTLVIVNSAVNLVIYVSFNKRFRQVMLQQVCVCTKNRGKSKANGTTQTLLTQV